MFVRFERVRSKRTLFFIMEFIVWYNRPAQKTAVALFEAVFLVACLAGYLTGGMYDSLRDSLIMLACAAAGIISGVAVYVIVSRFDGRYFIFDGKGIRQYRKNSLMREITWDSILKVGVWHEWNIGAVEFGPRSLRLEYVEKGEERVLVTLFSGSDAAFITESGLHEKCGEFACDK